MSWFFPNKAAHVREIVLPTPDVPPTSPARLLATSLTDPETRGEWALGRAAYHAAGFYFSSSTTYRNEARDITLKRTIANGGSRISSPFTLTKAEEAILSDALDAFHAHLRGEAEKAALARLLGEKMPPEPEQNKSTIVDRAPLTRARK